MFVLCAHVHTCLGCWKGEHEKALGLLWGQQALGTMEVLGPEEGADTVMGG